MKRVKAICRDLISCMKMSLIIGLGLILLSGLVSLIVTKANIIHTLEGVRGTLFVVGSMGLILGAVFILKKRTEKEYDHIEEWRKKYQIFSFKQVMIIISGLLIIYGSLVDLILFYYS